MDLIILCFKDYRNSEIYMMRLTQSLQPLKIGPNIK